MAQSFTGRRSFVGSLLAGSAALPSLAQQQQPPKASPQGYVPKQSDRPELLTADEPGFQSMFDGKTLKGWEGDPTYWRVEGGAIVGEIKPETIVKSNTFLIWRGGAPADFDLKVECRITAGGNSGINYRSTVVPDKVTPTNRFAMRGYQCDIDGQNRYTGNNYEEKGRLFLAVRGQVTRITGTRKPVVLATLQEEKDLASAVTDGWNTFHIVARGNVVMHSINGKLMCVVVDDDPNGRAKEGLIGVQVHVGGPMKVEYRNWRIKLA
jgi:hypothetical protein